MLTLELYGALERSAAFPRTRLRMEDIAGIDCSHFADFRELQDIRRVALATGRTDIVRALDDSARRSRRRSGVRRVLLALRHPWLATRKRLGSGKPPLET
jgi:hypothetical protein